MGIWLGVGNDRATPPPARLAHFPSPRAWPRHSRERLRWRPRAQATAVAASDVNEKCEAWLNPPDLVRRAPEVVPGYPDRLLPADDAAAAALKKRTLTPAPPGSHAYRRLNEVVADAYGWGDDWRSGALDDGAILARLFALNQERVAP